MASPLTLGAQRVAYGAASMARIGWYSLHYFAGRRIVGPLTKPGEAPYVSKSGPANLDELTASFRQLFRDEWKAIASGAMKMPHDLVSAPNPLALIRNSRDYFREARAVTRRAYAPKGHSEVLDKSAQEKYPRYYLQNFHFQSDGWLSEDSARVYDMQVETLFTGAADAMRRQAIPFIRDEIVAHKAAGRHQADLTFVDLACGTGRLLTYVKDNFPNMPTIAIDLSPDYLAEARRALSRWSGVEFINGAAEDMPLGDDTADMLQTVYLFHELPPKVRREVASEISRVLKPGGLYVHVDSLQYGDAPGIDLLLENFPRAFHEPYYDSYCSEDLTVLFSEAGLVQEGGKWGFLTKVTTFRKPV